MTPLSEAPLSGCAILPVAKSGGFMTSPNFGGLLSPIDREPALLPVAARCPTPAAEPAGPIVLSTETPSGSAGTLSPSSSNSDPVPVRGYAPEHVAPGTRFVVGTGSDPASAEPTADTVTTQAIPDLPAAITSLSLDPSPCASATTCPATVSTTPTDDRHGRLHEEPARADDGDDPGSDHNTTNHDRSHHGDVHHEDAEYDTSLSRGPFRQPADDRRIAIHPDNDRAECDNNDTRGGNTHSGDTLNEDVLSDDIANRDQTNSSDPRRVRVDSGNVHPRPRL